MQVIFHALLMLWCNYTSRQVSGEAQWFRECWNSKPIVKIRKIWELCIRKTNTWSKHQKWGYCEWCEKVFWNKLFHEECYKNLKHALAIIHAKKDRKRELIPFTKHIQNLKSFLLTEMNRVIDHLENPGKWIFISPKVVPCYIHNLS